MDKGENNQECKFKINKKENKNKNKKGNHFSFGLTDKTKYLIRTL